MEMIYFFQSLLKYKIILKNINNTSQSKQKYETLSFLINLTEF